MPLPFTHHIPESLIWAEESKLRCALDVGGYPHHGIELFPTGILAVIKNWISAATQRGIQVRQVDWKIDEDGAVVAEFRAESEKDVVGFKLLVASQ